MKKEYPHANHRQRVRKAFIDADKAKIPDINLLEFLLFYSIPRKDTKEIAARLIEKYQTIDNVFSLSFEELKQFDGLGESSALLISMINEISRRALKKESRASVKVDEESIINRFQIVFQGSESEIFCIACLDAFGLLTGVVPVATGDENSVEIRKRAVLETAFDYSADSIILAHNHPHEVSAPSKADIDLTKELKSLFDQMDIRLIDHLIFGTDGMLSLRKTEKFRPVFENYK